jgi:hypothetical protein
VLEHSVEVGHVQLDVAAQWRTAHGRGFAATDRDDGRPALGGLAETPGQLFGGRWPFD